MSYILSPAPPQGHVMSVRCEQPLNELTAQVWLRYYHQTLNIALKMTVVGIMDKQTDGQFDS